jgi:hypothetical protein
MKDNIDLDGPDSNSPKVYAEEEMLRGTPYGLIVLELQNSHNMQYSEAHSLLVEIEREWVEANNEQTELAAAKHVAKLGYVYRTSIASSDRTNALASLREVSKVKGFSVDEKDKQVQINILELAHIAHKQQQLLMESATDKATRKLSVGKVEEAVQEEAVQEEATEEERRHGGKTFD